MKASPRDRRISFQRLSGATRNQFNEKVQSWTPFADAFAQVIFGTGAERREAAQTTATASATFRVLDNPDTRSLTPKDRIVFDGGSWDIKGNVPSIALNDHREITAVRRTDGS